MVLVVDTSLGLDPAPDLHVVARGRSRRGWAPPVLEDALEQLDAVAEPIVLAADPVTDPGAAPLWDAALAARAEIVRLPDEPGSRAFLVTVGRRWCADATDGLAGRLRTLASALASAPGPDGVAGLGARAIARWAGRAGVECHWCRGGRHVHGGPCARCGAAGT